MRYSTRLLSPEDPWNGEPSGETNTPLEHAESTLRPGQWMDGFDAANGPDQRQVLWRFYHAPWTGIHEVRLPNAREDHELYQTTDCGEYHIALDPAGGHDLPEIVPPTPFMDIAGGGEMGGITDCGGD